MATSPIYGWSEPDNTDLVKNGALAIRTLGNAIDTTMGTMVAKTIIDAKGDLIAGSAADTALRLAVGSNGETLVADSSASTGLRYQGNFAAGKNKVLNSDFSCWQRGTSFSNLGFVAFAADRWQVAFNGNTTSTTSQQTFTPGASPLAGYDGQYFMRSLLPVIGTTTAYQLLNTIENVQTLNGQTATLSFFAKADSARTSSVGLEQNFGSGGSASVQTAFQSFNLTTSWQRFTLTFTVPSISGKTIGTGSFLRIIVAQVAASGSQLDLWGFQLEAGSVATAFQTATGTLQGELAACQRYYYENSGLVGTLFNTAFIARATSLHPVEMRVTPTVTVSNAVTFIVGNVIATATGTITNYSTTRSLQTDVVIGTIVANVGSSIVRAMETGKITVSAEL
jgi:hypothetical protein